MAAGPRERVTKPGVQVDSSVALVGSHLTCQYSSAPIKLVADLVTEITIERLGAVAQRPLFR